MPERKIVFVGGGSGGHIAPLFPVIAAVLEQAPKTELHYIGLAADISSPLVATSQYPLIKHTIEAGKLNRFATVKHGAEFVGLIRGCRQAWRLLRQIQPDVVFSKGGFVSIPVALAAAMQGIPIYAHETDVVLGLANRVIAKMAHTIFVSYPLLFYKNSLPIKKLLWTGQPVRQEFYSQHASPLLLNGREITGQLPLLTIIGGSQGARRLNKLISSQWKNYVQACNVVHICGPLDLTTLQQELKHLTEQEKSRLWLMPYVKDELPQLFQSSKVVISRAGGTIFELAASHTPVILVPLSTAAQDHQNKNARAAADQGACLVFDESTGTAEQLRILALELVNNQAQQQEMIKALSILDKPKAAHIMAKILLCA